MYDTAPFDAASQHGPRPLPLFLDLLRCQTATDPKRTKDALAGLRAYQAAERIPRPAPLPEAVRVGRASLIDYGGTGTPVVFVPSLINPAFVLDLAENNSMLRWLATQNMRPLLLDWGEATPEERDLDVGGHVERYLIPLTQALGEPPVLAGYCLGGTMALAAAALTPVKGLALIATPWNFHGFPQDTRAGMATLWAGAQATCERMGLLPMEVLQTAFWRLDPERTISKFENFGRLPPDSEAAQAFVALEDWANGGAPLTYAAGRQLFEDFIERDLPGQAAWSVGGRQIVPEDLTCPVLDIVSLTDRIVPAATSTELEERIETAAGHVGMVVGRGAKDTLWQPLVDWLSRLQHN